MLALTAKRTVKRVFGVVAAHFIGHTPTSVMLMESVQNPPRGVQR
jgi:hypothetical protein